MNGCNEISRSASALLPATMQERRTQKRTKGNVLRQLQCIPFLLEVKSGDAAYFFEGLFERQQEIVSKGDEVRGSKAKEVLPGRRDRSSGPTLELVLRLACRDRYLRHASSCPSHVEKEREPAER